MPEIILKKDYDRRLRIGHLWIFSNEIAEIRGLSSDGEIVDIKDSRGGFVGKGYLNRRSLISARVLTYKDEAVDREIFLKKIKAAIERHQRFLPDLKSLRLIHSEGDFLPGLIVDRYGDAVAIQTLTLGMEIWKNAICDILEELSGQKEPAPDSSAHKWKRGESYSFVFIVTNSVLSALLTRRSTVFPFADFNAFL